MKCPKCQSVNDKKARYCLECGQKIELRCPSCGHLTPGSANYCSECGGDLTKTFGLTPYTGGSILPSAITDHERKHVTILFSDLSGYTAMTEKLDPEEVKEIMDRIFGKISRVVVKYEGFIEKFVGDAVMAIFGVPKVHEDDPVRAIRAAREIHNLIKEVSPSLEKIIGRPLYMHTGIKTGLVVAQDINCERGTHGVLGDTINVAFRLSSLAKTDEILVGLETHHQAEGYFNFAKLEPTKVKGKEEPIQIYRVLSPREAPAKIHRLSGLRSELIGRKAEMDQLQEAVMNLKQGRASCFSIIGDAGTGKSRLVEEFRNSLDPESVRWREGHAYAYSQNIPYFPLIDLLNRAWQVAEGDPPDLVRRKVEKGTKAILGERKDLTPYIGSLYSLSYPEIEKVSPDQWKAKLHEALYLLLAIICKRSPTVICIEDLHWADPSSVELLRNILIDMKYSVMILCIYRPSFSLFAGRQRDDSSFYHEIHLQDLSLQDTQSMVESLLKTQSIPGQLQSFLKDKAEGNPFYLEEVINSLIETEILIQDQGAWKLTRVLTEKDIPSTVQGVISARLDRLRWESKRILQEASVIGRAFLYEILKRITGCQGHLDKSLADLEGLDLIKLRSLQPELEYIFKHVLTQEVVYNGLLIKERRVLHNKVGQVMEDLFCDHLPEFYETLAFHYSQSENTGKAFEYLNLSGAKAAKNYANHEAIRFYREAIQVLDTQPQSLENKKAKLAVFLKISNMLVFLSYPEGSLEIFKNAEQLTQELDDEEDLLAVQIRLSLYYTTAGNPSLGLEYAVKSFNSAEKIRDFALMAESANQVCAACWVTGDTMKIVDIGGRAIRLLEEHHLEKGVFGRGMDLSMYSTISGFYGAALGWRGQFMEGDCVLDKGFRNACDVNDKFNMGYIRMFHSTLMYWAGYGDATIRYAKEAIKILEEAEISLLLDIAWSMLGAGFFLREETDKAIEYGEKGLSLAKEIGLPFMLSWSYWFIAMTLLRTENLKRARECAAEALRISRECHAKAVEGLSLILMGYSAQIDHPATVQEAERRISHGILILEDHGFDLLSAIGYLLLGEFLADRGRKLEALASLKKAGELYHKTGITARSYWFKRTRDSFKRLASGSDAMFWLNDVGHPSADKNNSKCFKEIIS